MKNQWNQKWPNSKEGQSKPDHRKTTGKCASESDVAKQTKPPSSNVNQCSKTDDMSDSHNMTGSHKAQSQKPSLCLSNSQEASTEEGSCECKGSSTLHQLSANGTHKKIDQRADSRVPNSGNPPLPEFATWDHICRLKNFLEPHINKAETNLEKKLDQILELANKKKPEKVDLSVKEKEQPEKRLVELQSKIEMLTKKGEKALEQIADLQSEIGMLKAENAMLKSENTMLKSENNMLKVNQSWCEDHLVKNLQHKVGFSQALYTICIVYAEDISTLRPVLSHLLQLLDMELQPITRKGWFRLNFVCHPITKLKNASLENGVDAIIVVTKLTSNRLRVVDRQVYGDFGVRFGGNDGHPDRRYVVLLSAAQPTNQNIVPFDDANEMDGIPKEHLIKENMSTLFMSGMKEKQIVTCDINKAVIQDISQWIIDLKTGISSS